MIQICIEKKNNEESYSRAKLEKSIICYDFSPEKSQRAISLKDAWLSFPGSNSNSVMKV